MAEPKPLALDVDGTFLRTDILYEALWAGLGRAPLKTLALLAANFRHPARLKAGLHDLVDLRVDLLPVNAEVATMARAAADRGQPVILASASDQRIVTALAEVHGLDKGSLGSDPSRNLKAGAKAQALIRAYGEGGFDYAGDSRADRAVWDKADRAVIVGPRGAEAARLRDAGHKVTEIAGGWSFRDLLRAIRPHQWVKNVLLILPMIAAHDFTLTTLLPIILGIAAFSAAASSIYVVNDLLDLEADRLHPTKKNRPFASGAVPIRVGMAACLLLGAGAIGLASLLNPAFMTIVIGYMVLSLAYSLKLKRMRWIDIFTLAGLYTVRVVAGAAAGEVQVSIYMLIFIFPAFLTLGCVKRLTELAFADGDNPLPGRGYGRRDRGDLLNMAALGTVGALVIFVLYTFSPQAATLYPTQWILWLALLPIGFWLIRMVLLGYHGQQDFDPIVFAMRDRMGIGILLIALSLMFWAAGLWAEWFG